MTPAQLELLKYPIGKFVAPDTVSDALLNEWITTIEGLPKKLNNAVQSLSDEQLDTPYRPEGWSVRQVIHHIADSHMNAYLRFKLALTEDTPTIKPYDEQAWAMLFDYTTEVESSLQLITALHAKWALLLKGMSSKDFEKQYYHPENKQYSTLQHVTGMYAWHSNHHLAHITHLAKRSDW
jgi:hypothetical protein